MTKELLGYADALNTFGSDIPDTRSTVGAVTAMVTETARYLSDRSRGTVHCPWGGCPAGPYAWGGADDGEQYALLWEHLITEHKYTALAAEIAARRVWGLSGDRRSFTQTWGHAA